MNSRSPEMCDFSPIFLPISSLRGVLPISSLRGILPDSSLRGVLPTFRRFRHSAIRTSGVLPAFRNLQFRTSDAVLPAFFSKLNFFGVLPAFFSKKSGKLNTDTDTVIRYRYLPILIPTPLSGTGSVPDPSSTVPGPHFIPIPSSRTG